MRDLTPRFQERCTVGGVGGVLLLNGVGACTSSGSDSRVVKRWSVVG